MAAELPAAITLAGSATSARLSIPLTPTLVYFQGHFPGHPILPGVAQVDWAVRYARQVFGPLGAFTALDRIKFQDLALPGETLELSLEWDPEARRLSFSYHCGERQKSGGRIRFTA